MVGLVPTIHVFVLERVFKTWMLATRASMTDWIRVTPARNLQRLRQPRRQRRDSHDRAERVIEAVLAAGYDDEPPCPLDA